MVIGPRQLEALILVPSALLVLGAAYGVVRGAALIVPGKVNRADDATLFWTAVGAGALIGATGVLVGSMHVAGRVTTRDAGVYGFALLLAVLLAQLTISDVRRGETLEFREHVRRSEGPNGFRITIAVHWAWVLSLIGGVLLSLALGHPII